MTDTASVEHPSPFIIGTTIQYAWDSTSIGWLKECPRKYYYSMIKGYRTKSESIHLSFGRWYHSALETYDKALSAGLNHEDALDAALDFVMKGTWVDGKPWDSDHTNKTRETLVRTVIWYIEHFRDDPAQTVQLANGKPAVELSFKMPLDWGPHYTYNLTATQVENRFKGTGDQGPERESYILCGHLDRLVNFSGGTYVMDRKTTTTTVASNYFDQYDPDNQMSLYTLAAKVIYATPVKGVIIDAAQIAVGFSRFSRGFTYRTDNQITEWLADLKSWFSLAETYALNNNWPMNDKSCHKYGGCAFRKVCSKSPEIRDKFIESDFIVQPWNPLVPR